MEGGAEEEAANKLGNACPQRAPTNGACPAALTAAVEMTTNSTRGALSSGEQRQLGRLGNTSLGKNCLHSD